MALLNVGVIFFARGAQHLFQKNIHQITTLSTWVIYRAQYRQNPSIERIKQIKGLKIQSYAIKIPKCTEAI